MLQDDRCQAVELPNGPPLWSSGQGSWLQFESRRYQIF
jgi:hypothetical protein